MNRWTSAKVEEHWVSGQLLQSAQKALSTRLEKPLGLRSKGCINEQSERHESVTGTI